MMDVDVIVGCQFGSEGKGLVAGEIARRNKYDLLISVNSAQAGHTVYHLGKKYVLRQLPAACVVNREAKIYVGPGASINLSVLKDEIDLLEQQDVPITDRLYINGCAGVITEEHEHSERTGDIVSRIGSTAEGVGAAMRDRVMRKSPVMRDFPSHGRYQIIEGTIWNHKAIIWDTALLEGSQGYGLSNYSKYYPFCTSRDTTTAAFIGYAGLSPRMVRDVYGVFRTFPIRVGGNSGPLHEEIDWPTVAKESGYATRGIDITEITTVTKRVRRVGRWNKELAYEASVINGVSKPILTFVNYLNCDYENCKCYGDFPKEFWDKMIEFQVGHAWWALSVSKDSPLIILE